MKKSVLINSEKIPYETETKYLRMIFEIKLN